MDEELENSFEKISVATSTPSQTRENFCIEDNVKQATPSPDIQETEPPVRAIIKETNTSNNQVREDEMMDYPEPIPEDLAPRKELIKHTETDDYMPLMSAVTLVNKKECFSYH